METKERMTGLRFAVQPTRENIAQCSELSAKLLRELVERHKITYNQILYPYADALSLSGAAGTQSTRIFGTHILLRNVPDEIIENVNPKNLTDDNVQNPLPEYETETLPLTEGAVKSTDIAKFLTEGKQPEFPSAGDFAKLLSGWLPHWRIRECSRIFASFSEMAYRRAKGQVIGLYGGKLILTPECDCQEALGAIFTQKTGVV